MTLALKLAEITAIFCNLEVDGWDGWMDG